MVGLAALPPTEGLGGMIAKVRLSMVEGERYGRLVWRNRARQARLLRAGSRRSCYGCTASTCGAVEGPKHPRQPCLQEGALNLSDIPVQYQKRDSTDAVHR